jgi:hypothetical protein
MKDNYLSRYCRRREKYHIIFIMGDGGGGGKADIVYV